MRNSLLYLFLILFLINCKKDTGRNLNEAAQYKVVFNINWDSTAYPMSYPSNPHFSPIVGWSHQPSSVFFSTGSLASEGIRQMAERGKVNPLDDEINNRIMNGEGYKLFVGDGLGSGVGNISLDVEIDKNNPSVTLVSMLAPSPDWYIGAINVLLYEDDFVETRTVNLLVFDAGTDSGTTYTSSDTITTPQSTISLLVDTPLGNGSMVTPVIGTAIFVKQ